VLMSFFFSSRRRHTRFDCDWSSDVSLPICSRDLAILAVQGPRARERFTQAFPHTAEATQALSPFTGALAGEMMIARTGYTGEDEIGRAAGRDAGGGRVGTAAGRGGVWMASS